MKSIEVVAADSLEETLSCDDLFLEYFNNFLALPAFPQRLCYSRFTGTFHDLDVETVPLTPIRQENEESLSDLKESPNKRNGGFGLQTSVYGAKEDERERVIRWAREYRLPLFQETRMYRELKLCKLLLRPLDLRRGSSRIRGYSRLSMGFATTTSLLSGTGRLETPSHVLTSLDNHSVGGWPGGSKFVASIDSRPTSRAFSLPPTLERDKNWSATALYDTSGTTNSSTGQDDYNMRQATRPRTHKRRYPNMDSSSKQQDQSQTSRMQMYSDSGLGTTALDYAQSVGTSVKTRNVLTRADTLGVGSRWESEEDYETKTPESRVRTGLTSSSLAEDEYLTPPAVSIWNKAKYEGKSALRTADSPSKPHRATIVLPKTKSTNPVVRIVTESSGGHGTNETTMTTTTTSNSDARQEEADDETFYDDSNEDIDEFDDDVGDFLDFDDRESSCEETETEIASIEKVHSMSMQHIKERIFQTKSGVDSFFRFIRGTAGEDLVEFWLDTEAFKDSVEKYMEKRQFAVAENRNHDHDTESSLRVRRHRLFRSILDRHKFILTDEARDQIRHAQANGGLSHHVFSRSQYDVLRRLRSYWLPRFVVHKDSEPKFKERLVSGNWEDDDLYVYNPQVHNRTIRTLPTFSIGYIDLQEDTRTKDSQLSVLTLESATSQVINASPSRPSTSQLRQMSARSASFHYVIKALIAEVEAGFPLRNYLRTHESRSLANAYDFLMCLEYLSNANAGKFQLKGNNEKSSQTVVLEGVQAYSLYSTFLAKDSPNNIHLPRKSSLLTMEHVLKKATAPGKDCCSEHSSIVPVTIFRHVKNYAVNVIASALKKYQQYEMSKYYEYREGKLCSDFESDTKVESTPKTSTKTEESTATMSETTSSFSKAWLTDDDSTETDSASTMYSYDMERLKQLAQKIRQKGAKKPQRTPPKKAHMKKPLKRGTTAVKGHQASKVQFNLPNENEDKEKGDSRDGEDGNDDEEEEEENGSEEEKSKKKKKSKFQQHPNRMTFSEIRENKLLYTFFRKYVSQCESVEIQNIMQMYQLCDALMGIPGHEVDRKNAISTELVRTFLHPSGPKQIAMPSERTAQFYEELPNPSNDSISILQNYVTSPLDQAAANFSLGFGTVLKEYKLTLKSDLGQHMNKAELALRSLTLKPSSKRRKALGKHSARQTPTSEHKVMFLEALERAKEGSLPLELVHFLKYLQGFGPQEGYPLIHNGLLFYVEVSKFIASFHEDHDLITLKRKILSIRDCFIDSQMEKTLQIDIKTGTAERLRRAMDAFVTDRGRDPHVATLFDDAQHTVFNELLPFWAGFVTAMSPSEREGKRPMLKGERMQKRRLEAFLKTQDPQVEFILPFSQPKFDMKGIEFTFSVTGGIQWKAWSEASSSRSSTPPVTGVIEVVKAPPTGQRRIVRRSGFTIRKLKSSKDEEKIKPAFPATKTVGSSGKKNKNVKRSSAAANAVAQTTQGNVTYATSVT